MRRIEEIFDLERTIDGADRATRLAVRRAEVAPLVTDLETWMRSERAHPHQVAHRLMGFVGHPDLDQVTGAQVLRQRHRIAAVVLHPITGFAGNQGWSHHVRPTATSAVLRAKPLRWLVLLPERPRSSDHGELLASPTQPARLLYQSAILFDKAARIWFVTARSLSGCPRHLSTMICHSAPIRELTGASPCVSPISS